MIEEGRTHYKYTPANVLQKENFKLCSNRRILTDKTLLYIRPDITFRNKKTKNNFLIGMDDAIKHNVAKTITDKQNNYQEMGNEICATSNEMAEEITSIVISSTGVNPKTLSQSPKKT